MVLLAIHFMISKYKIRKFKTRRVAVYLETRCSIGLKTALPTGIHDR